MKRRQHRVPAPDDLSRWYDGRVAFGDGRDRGARQEQPPAWQAPVPARPQPRTSSRSGFSSGAGRPNQQPAEPQWWRPSEDKSDHGYRVPPPPRRPPAGRRQPTRREGPGCFALFFIALVVLVTLVLVTIAAMTALYASIAATLPPPEALQAQSARFLSTRIYDRNGHLLHEIVDPSGGRRIWVPYEQMSPHLINGTVATEDERFWQHPGVDPISILRAVVQNVQEGDIVSGASTIPQTLVDNVLFTPEERTEMTMSRKVREAVLAMEVSRRYSKREILEIYLNEVWFGNLAFGIEAAANTYFGKASSELTLGEASLLAGLPQAPAYWDPYTNFDRAKRRQAVVLALMVESGYITPAEAEAAKAQELHLEPLRFDVESPHFVVWVQQLLEEKYSADVIYRSGLQVTTTLDSSLQDLAQQEVQAHLETLADRNATNASLVAIRPDTGEILAMLGSADFYDEEISGQVNVALRPRQPGSSIKPVTYVAAFEQGWTPATLIWDVKTEFTDALGRPYVPKNYDRKEHGPVLVRGALARSLNVPAVKALDFVGLPAMLDTARRMGITSLNRADYGLSLTLGGGEVTLLEMAGAYAVLANGGQRVPPVGILRIEDAAGRVIEEHQPPSGEQVITPQHAYLMTDILSDNGARAPAFGRDNPLNLPSRRAAAKTGTTDDWRDSWTIGYTPELVTGVWVGNADNSEMDKVTGSQGAAPIWQSFMDRALAGRPASQFARPEGIEEIEISADAGSLPGDACPPDRRRTEIFAAGQGPLGPEYDFHQMVRIDTTTDGLATAYCPANVVEERYFKVMPGVDGQKWAMDHNIPQPPGQFCPVHTGPAQVALFQPIPGETVAVETFVAGRANMPDFDHYIVEYGEGRDPLGWGPVAGPVYTPVDSGMLAVWDVRSLADRDYTLRVVVYDHLGNGVEARTWVWVQNPTPTPTPTPTQTHTPTPTWTPTATLTPAPTWTPTLEPTATITPTLPPTYTPAPTGAPTGTPAPTETARPSATPTDAPVPTATDGPTDIPVPTDTPTITPTPLDTANPIDTPALPSPLPSGTPPPVDTPEPPPP